MARSSNTSTERITGVSRLPSRPRSASTFATIPDDEMLVTPPSTVAPTGPQPERERHGDARRRVEHDVEHAGGPRAAQAGRQLGGGVLQAEQQEQQHHAHLARERGEVADVAQRDDAAGAEAQAADQVERDRRHPDPAGQPAQQAEPEEDGAELDQLERGVAHRAAVPWSIASAVLEDLESAVEALGRADGDHEVARGQREVRAAGWGAPARPASRRPPRRPRGCAVRCRRACGRRTASRRRSVRRPVRMPGRSRCSSASCATSCGAPSRLASAPASSVVSGSSASVASGSSALETISASLPSRCDDDPDATPVAQGEVLAHPDPRQRRHLDVHATTVSRQFRHTGSRVRVRKATFLQPDCMKVAFLQRRERAVSPGPGAATRSPGSGSSPSSGLRRAPAPRPPRRSPRAGTTRRAPSSTSAWSAISPARRELTKTSTTSTSNGMSASVG